MLWETFTRYDESGSNTIAKGSLTLVLFDVGLMPIYPKSKLRVAIEESIEEVGRPENPFDLVLNLMNDARLKCKDVSSVELQNEFKHYDHDHDRRLGMTDIYEILEHFKMLPKTSAE